MSASDRLSDRDAPSAGKPVSALRVPDRLSVPAAVLAVCALCVALWAGAGLALRSIFG